MQSLSDSELGEYCTLLRQIFLLLDCKPEGHVLAMQCEPGLASREVHREDALDLTIISRW